MIKTIIYFSLFSVIIYLAIGILNFPKGENPIFFPIGINVSEIVRRINHDKYRHDWESAPHRKISPTRNTEWKGYIYQRKYRPEKSYSRQNVNIWDNFCKKKSNCEKENIPWDIQMGKGKFLIQDRNGIRHELWGTPASIE